MATVTVRALLSGQCSCMNHATPPDCSLCGNLRYGQRVVCTIEDPLPRVWLQSRVGALLRKVGHGPSISQSIETEMFINDLKRKIAEDEAEWETLSKKMDATRKEYEDTLRRYGATSSSPPSWSPSSLASAATSAVASAQYAASLHEKVLLEAQAEKARRSKGRWRGRPTRR